MVTGSRRIIALFFFICACGGRPTLAQCQLEWSPAGAISDAVFALATYDDGSGPALYAGGPAPFGVPSFVLHKWNGSAWEYMTWPFSSVTVRAMVVHDDGTGPALYVGGSSFVARWDGKSWTALPAAGNVRSLASYDAGLGVGPELYAGVIGGTFDL